MSSSKRTQKPKIRLRDQKKEGTFKELSERLRSAGYEVRRERLKTGHGWKAVSGSCRAEQVSYIFVDSRLSQDDQIVFLRARLRELKLDDEIESANA